MQLAALSCRPPARLTCMDGGGKGERGVAPGVTLGRHLLLLSSSSVPLSCNKAAKSSSVQCIHCKQHVAQHRLASQLLATSLHPHSRAATRFTQSAQIACRGRPAHTLRQCGGRATDVFRLSRPATQPCCSRAMDQPPALPGELRPGFACRSGPPHALATALPLEVWLTHIIDRLDGSSLGAIRLSCKVTGIVLSAGPVYSDVGQVPELSRGRAGESLSYAQTDTLAAR